VAAARANALFRGFADLFGPVRPTGKSAEPRADGRLSEPDRADGLPEDPWLRVHTGAGGRVVAVCPTSMTIAAP
jgi:hypothetical protein